MLAPQEAFHGRDTLFVMASLAFDARANPGVIADAVGILDASRAVAVVQRDELVAARLEVGRRLRRGRIGDGRSHDNGQGQG
jgi:hypothetical protein